MGGGALTEDQSESARDAWLDEARARVEQPGEYLCYEEGGELRTVALTREWTRIGRASPPTCASTTRPSRAATR